MHTRRLKVIERVPDDFHFELKRIPKHIAYLFDGNKLIAIATNKLGCHAEIGLIPHIRKYRRQSIYVRRISSVNCMSRPCVHCTNAIRHVNANIKVFYTDLSGKWVEDKNLDNTHESARSRTGLPGARRKIYQKKQG